MGDLEPLIPLADLEPLLAGLGWALVFTPSLGAVSRYFPTRRAMATGLAMAGASVVGLALGPLIPLLLDGI